MLNDMNEEHESDGGSSTKIYESFACHLGTIGCETSRRLVEIKQELRRWKA